MKELMKKLGMKEYGADYDLVVEGPGFLEIEDLIHLEEFDIPEDSKAKVYLRTQQKQIYELTENKKYMVAHGENGSDESLSAICQKCHFGLTKDEVVAFVKKYFRDFVGSYIMIFEEDAWISVKEYISMFKKEVKEVVANKEMIILSRELGISTLKAGEELKEFGYHENSEALIFYKDDSVQINNLDNDNYYTIVMLSVNCSQGRTCCGKLSKQDVLETVNTYINDYAQKNLLIFEDKKAISVKEYYKMSLEKDLSQNSSTNHSLTDEDMVVLCALGLLAQEEPAGIIGNSNNEDDEEANVCPCCGKDASKAVWRDLAMFRGGIIEVREVVTAEEGSEEVIYDCDKWFDTVEKIFRKYGVLRPSEDLRDFEDSEFFASAFSDETVRALMFSRYPEKFEPGAYCLYCDASL